MPVPYTVSEKPKVVHILILGLLILAGACLRIYGLEVQSFWNDELHTVRLIRFSSVLGVVFNLQFDVASPGYFVLMYFIQEFIGYSESIFRFPSVIAGVLCIPAIFLLGKTLFNTREGLIGAALLTFLWCPIYYSQEARPYSILLLFSILTPYFWIRIVSFLKNNEKATRLEVIAYILTSAVMSYLHSLGLFFAFLLGLLGMALLLKNRAAMIRFVLIECWIFLAILPWIPFTIVQFRNPNLVWIPKPGLSSFREYFDFLFRGFYLLQLSVLSVYLFLIVQGIRALRTRTFPGLLESPVLLLFLWLIVPFLFLFSASLITKPMLVYRYLIILMPAAYLLVARGITQLPAKIQIPGAILLISFFFYDLVAVREYYSRITKAQFREAVRVVVDHQNQYPDAVIIGNRPPSHFNYYLKLNHSKQEVVVRAQREGDLVRVAQYVKKKRSKHIWYVVAHSKPEPQFMEKMMQQYQLERVWRFRNASVRLYRVSSNPK